MFITFLRLSKLKN